MRRADPVISYIVIPKPGISSPGISSRGSTHRPGADGHVVSFAVQPSDVRAASVDIGTYADRIGQAEKFVADHRSTELLPLPSTDHEDLLQLNQEANRQ
jgi:hypothetical protein